MGMLVPGWLSQGTIRKEKCNPRDPQFPNKQVGLSPKISQKSQRWISKRSVGPLENQCGVGKVAESSPHSAAGRRRVSLRTTGMLA